MNRSQDFRYFMKNHCPILLEGFYELGEKLDGDDTMRRLDLLAWQEKRDEH